MLARLKELAKIAALAKYLAGKKVPLDLEALFAIPPQPVATPATTKAIKVVSPNVLVTQTGNGTSRRTISLCGGVDFRPPPLDIEEDANGEPGASTIWLRQPVHPRRPRSGNSRATPERCGRKPFGGIGAKANPRYFDDYSRSAQDLFRVRRSYDVSAREGDFGAGWSFWIPISLSVRQSAGKKREVRKEGTATSPSGPVFGSPRSRIGRIRNLLGDWLRG